MHIFKKSMLTCMIVCSMALIISACGTNGDNANQNTENHVSNSNDNNDNEGNTELSKKSNNNDNNNEDNSNENKDDKESDRNLNSNDSENEEKSDTLSEYSDDEIEYARVWLEVMDNNKIDTIKISHISEGEHVNPYDNDSVKYPEDVIMLIGTGVAGNPGAVYSGNGDGTINLYDIPSHWQEGIEEDKTMKEYTREIVDNPEKVDIDAGDEDEVQELIEKIEMED